MIRLVDLLWLVVFLGSSLGFTVELLLLCYRVVRERHALLSIGNDETSKKVTEHRTIDSHPLPHLSYLFIMP